MRTLHRRVLAVFILLGVGTALVAGPAAAHVTVSSPDAARGGYGKLIFRVPNESDSAATTKLQVTLPKKTPLASVRPKAYPGWQVRVNEVKLPEPVEVGDLTLTEAVRTVTWTARPGQGIGVDRFAEFELAVGPFPTEATTLLFPTVQTYADGEVVRWNQPMPADGTEPEHPAPALDLSAAGADAGQSAAADTSNAAVRTETAGESDPSDTAARVMAASGIMVATVALGGVLIRRRPAEPTDRGGD